MPPLLKGGGARLARDGGIQRPQKATETSRTDKDVRPYACIKFILCYVRFFASLRRTDFTFCVLPVFQAFCI